MRAHRTYAGGALQFVVAVTLSVAVAAEAAPAKQSLRDVKPIDDGLFEIALADQIRKKCSAVSPRLMRAYGALRALEQEARALGYTAAEIESFVESDVEKARMRKRETAYFKARGIPQDTSGYCRLGREEIERDTGTGRLLRLK
jgi:hypothetical protein